MKRTIIFFALAAMAALSPLFAQTQSEFRSASSGMWTDSRIWEKNEAGVWLKPVSGDFPGERHDRNTNVTVDDGSTVTIGKDQVVQINSLAVMNGRVVVEGMLIIGPVANDPYDPVSDPISISENPITPPVTGDNPGPQLLQNMPNPLAPQFGYETTIKFYLDKAYSNARIRIFDQLAHVVKEVYNESSPTEGWHTVKVQLDRIQAGSYPMVLELPSTVLHRMITVLR